MPTGSRVRRRVAMSEAASGVGRLTAVIMAGGLGTRLRSVLADRPKVLAPVGGRPFLTYLLDQVAGYGISHVVLCTGHLGDQVPVALGTCYRGIRLTYSREATPLGTAGALRLALPLLESEVVLVMNGDSYCAADLEAFWASHRSRRCEASLLLRRMPETARYGSVLADPEGCVHGFHEKRAGDGPGWISAGIYLFSRRLVGTIPSGGPVSLELELFPRWAALGVLYGYADEGGILDIGTPEGYAGSHAQMGVAGTVWRAQRMGRA